MFNSSQRNDEKPRGEVRPAHSDRAKRQSDLLDEGLMETFPASDPVSVVLVS